MVLLSITLGMVRLGKIGHWVAQEIWGTVGVMHRGRNIYSVLDKSIEGKPLY